METGERSSMKKTPLVAALTLAFTGSLALHAQTTLDSTLAQMDKASAGFKSATASVHQEIYLKAIHAVDTKQDGSVYFERANGSIGMGLTLTNEGATTKPQVVQYANGTLQDFNPGPDTLDIFKSNGNSSLADTFLTLGFGVSGKDLTRSWNVTDQGSETINGTKTEKLDLVPKDSKVKENFTHVTVWIDPIQDVSLKQIFYTPSGDYRTATYSAIKLNGKIDRGAFTIHTDKKTQINHH